MTFSESTVSLAYIQTESLDVIIPLSGTFERPAAFAIYEKCTTRFGAFTRLPRKLLSTQFIWKHIHATRPWRDFLISRLGRRLLQRTAI